MPPNTMQQRRPHSTTTAIISSIADSADTSTRKERREERREVKKLKRVKRGGTAKIGSHNVGGFLGDPYVQLAVAAFVLLTLTGATIFRMMHHDEDESPSRRFMGGYRRRTGGDSGTNNIGNNGLMNTLRGLTPYVIPESMKRIGNKAQWYGELRREYDTNILPKDDERSLRFVEAERQRHGDYRQSPKARTPYDIHDCPDHPPEGYPMQWPVLEVLDNWSPDDATPNHEIYQGFCIFDYRTELHKADNYRKKELPFIVRNDPAVARTAERWNHPGYMEKLLMGKEDTMRRAEYSPNNHFMYWVDRRSRSERRRAQKRISDRRKAGDDAHNGFGRGEQEQMAEAIHELEDFNKLKGLYEEAKDYVEDHDDDEAQEHFQELKKAFQKAREKKNEQSIENWKPPTENLRMTYLDWLKHANVTDDNLGPDNPHWYFRLIGCGAMGKGTEDGSCDKGSSEWLFDELTFFQPRTGDERSFYLVEPNEQKGIHCRFGMKGVIAENHFDLSRNAIVLLGGQRRYILGHPNQCNNMNLLPRGHPSARHSAVDWSDPDLDSFPTFEKAHVNEVVMQPGDVMYLPTNWFHYIISLELNFQCNTRSGGEKLYRKEINDCGF
mmetsp:Transcript_3149/g.6369  ORF Transcript_3149/g.6369 Transcript_3149/m.6369 type:complete len:610 (+) Transcript_3149:281-2110(+)